MCSSDRGTIYGLYVNYLRYSDVAFNSVQCRGTTGTAYGVYSYGETTNYDMKFLNNMVSYDGTGTFYWIYNYNAGSISAWDYNVHFKTGTSAAEYWTYGGTSYATLAALKSAIPTRNQNTVIGNPRWAGTADNHSSSLAAYQTGIPVTGITDDFDGDTRSSTVPCRGADEYILTNMAYKIGRAHV